MDDARTPEHLLVAPEADLNHLSFCDTNGAALTDWVADLPMANTGETATRLLKAAPEIARVRTTYLTRYELLEALRPTLYYICARVDRSMMSHPQNAEALAHHAQDLQRSLCEGYKAVVIATLGVIHEDKSAKELMQQATHRALSDLSRVLLRCQKLYHQPPAGLWRDINQLYHLAEQLNLADQKVRDTENHSQQTTTIRDAFLRPVLVWAAQPNQLRPQDMNQIYNAVESWCERVHVSSPGDTALLHMDLAADSGPRYTKVAENTQIARGVHTEVLAYEIEAYLREIESAVPVPDYVTPKLLRHVANAWGTVHTRNFSRLPSNDAVSLCVGLRTSYYFVSEGRELREQVDDTETKVRSEVNPFLTKVQEREPGKTQESERDIWTDALKPKIPENPHTSGNAILLSQPKNTGPRTTNHYVQHQTTSLDTSPTGYCLRWKEPPPPTLQVGELLALRDQDEGDWAIGTLRWLTTDRRGGVRTGIELLSPSAIPVAARVVRTKSGVTEFSRALLLPALPSIDQPETLITPRLPFQAQQKIQMQYGGRQITAHLDGCIRNTENFNQFTFRVLGSYLEKPASRRTMPLL